jgi:hypothetical protein
MHKFLLFCLVSSCYADCIFTVTNNSTQTVMVEAGFFNQKKTAFSILPASVANQVVKSDLTCLDVTKAGLGVSYINLVSGKSSGGWVYAPATKMIRAVGSQIVSADGRIGNTPNGLEVFLSNNAKPTGGTFEVEIKNIKRNVSRQLGSSD